MTKARCLLVGLVALAASVFFCGVSTICPAYASAFPENDELTANQIDERFNCINSHYAIGQEFSASDADFVNRYAQKPGGSKTRGSQTFNVSGRSVDGTTVVATGSLYHDGTFSYSYGGNVTVRKTAGLTPKSMRLTVHCTAYGIVGSGGVGIIYNDSVSYTAFGKSSFVAAPSRTSSGVLVSYVVEGWVDITTAKGNFFTIR